MWIRSMHRLVWGAVLGAGLATPAAGATADLPARAAAIDTYVARLGALGWQGIFLLEADGKVLVERGCGSADRERGTPWTARTVSDLGSITKQFTAAAILRLQEQGRLRVGDPLAKYIAGVPPDKAGITLHHLLTHTSGISDLPDKDDWDPVSRDDIVRLTMAAPLASAPGKRYEYSNAGYSLLGVVIETLTGTSYETFVRTALFEPAGMRDTGYVLAKWDTTLVAIGYRDGSRWGTTLERPFASDGPYWILRANGGIHSTADDMRRWAHALLDNRILTVASRQALWTQHVDESNGNGDSYYGYGWTVETLPDKRSLVKHNGGNGIFFAVYAIEPSERLVIFLMTNVAAEFPSGQVLDEIWPHLATGAPLPVLPAATPLAPEEAERLAGTYRIGAAPSAAATKATFAVRVEGNALAIEPPTWREFSQLYGATPQALDRLESQSRTVDAVVQASLRGDYAPLHTAYDGRVTLDVLRTRGEARLREEAERFGPLRRTHTVGTLLTEEGSMTYVRFEHERGTHYRRYVWNAEGKLRGMAQSRRGPPPRFYHDTTDFVSFEIGVPASHVAFVDTKAGGVSMEYGPKSAGSAYRALKE